MGKNLNIINLFTEYVRKSYFFLERNGFTLEESVSELKIETNNVFISHGHLRKNMGPSLFGALGHHGDGKAKLCLHMKDGSILESEWSLGKDDERPFGHGGGNHFEFSSNVNKEEIVKFRICYKEPLLWFFHPSYLGSGSLLAVIKTVSNFPLPEKALSDISFIRRFFRLIKTMSSFDHDIFWLWTKNKNPSWTPPSNTILDFWYLMALKERSSLFVGLFKVLKSLWRLKLQINLINEIEDQGGSVHWLREGEEELVKLRGQKKHFYKFMSHYKNRMGFWSYVFKVYWSLMVSIMKADEKPFYNALNSVKNA